MDRVGFEPTTSDITFSIFSSSQLWMKNKLVRIPPGPSFFSSYAIALDLQGKVKELSFTKKQSQIILNFSKVDVLILLWLSC
jgi:hypothetical protein